MNPSKKTVKILSPKKFNKIQKLSLFSNYHKSTNNHHINWKTPKKWSKIGQNSEKKSPQNHFLVETPSKIPKKRVKKGQKKGQKSIKIDKKGQKTVKIPQKINRDPPKTSHQTLDILHFFTFFAFFSNFSWAFYQEKVQKPSYQTLDILRWDKKRVKNTHFIESILFLYENPQKGQKHLTEFRSR